MTKERSMMVVMVTALLLALTPVWGAGPSFQPDYRFEGSSLTGWRTLGDAKWRARDGEIIGTPTHPEGGWLLLDRSYQDVGVYASFRSAAGGQMGVLLRAEQTTEGMKGIYVSLAEGDVASYGVTLDAEGRVLDRQPLRSAGGQVRIAPPPDPGDDSARRGGNNRERDQGTATPPITRPDASLRPGEWNDVEILLDADIVRAFLNNGGQATGGVAEDAAGRYGPIALYVGGTGEVRFREVASKDLALKYRPPEEVSSRFRMQRLSDFYYAWGAGAADFDRDGDLDVVAGPHVYFGPEFTTRREIYVALTSNPSDTYTTHAWMQYVADFTGDGWPDVINPSFTDEAGVWMYVNPQGEARRWDKHQVLAHFNTEVAVLSDVDADGKPELVYGAEGTVRYAEPNPADPTGPWKVHTISERGLSTAHGVGAGDINGDGRMDIVNPYGWWEQPPATDQQGLWTYHPEAFARYGRNILGGSVMGVYDVNGDRLNDIVTVLNPHGWGLAWFEQKRDNGGTISFERHMIMDDYGTENAGGVTFSQPHGSTVADVDGDDVPDFVVGKRYWAHRDNYLDPDPYGPAVLYWYRTVRDASAPGGAELVPELIHNRSGAGSDLLATDLDGDGQTDIVTATRFGTFIFWGRAAAR